MVRSGKQNRQPTVGRRERGAGSAPTYLRVVDVMHLIENDEFDVSDKVRTLVKHTPEDLRSHD